MAAESDVDTSRAVVKAYVPRYQRDEWDEHADDLDMSRSEFVRCMVQAGRSDFDLSHTKAADSPKEPERPELAADEPDSAKSVSTSLESTADGIESDVLAALEGSEYLSWEDLLAEITEGIEDRLEDALQDLQASNRITYSGRHDGYVLNR